MIARVVRICVVTGAAAAVLIGLSEVVMRRFPQLMPIEKQLVDHAIHSPFQATAPDPDVGFVALPGQRRQVRTSDYVSLHETDDRGFPNAEPWPDRAALVFLGDSLAIGYGVGWRASFPHLIAGTLSTRAINLAVAGAGPERQAAIYRKFGTGLRPRHVIACVYLAADFDNDQHFNAWVNRGRTGDYNALRLAMAGAKNGSERPAFLRHAEKSWLFANGRDWVRSELFARPDPPDRHVFPDGSETLLGRSGVAFATTDAVRTDARVEQLVVSLAGLRALVHQGGGSLSVVLVPSREELFGAPPSLTAANVVSRARDRLAGEGFSVVDVYPDVFRAGATRAPYFRVDSHFNEYGHRVVADAFVTWFRRAFPDGLESARVRDDQ